MNSSIEADDVARGTADGEDVGATLDAIVVYEWDADSFHQKVSNLERQGYVARRETYRVTPEMNPETGRIVHLHTIELNRGLPGEPAIRNPPFPPE
jgi:hypothetical protein